ncbi:MAG TPA: glycosyltransferase [Candidatus Acidoferrales bacterium]|nr:glycosyltransferase [Candidatus Acidoferrales bacterium]
MSARVSVVLAVYNAAWCVERALDSVMAQTAPPAEVLLCDDGSTDGTPERVERRYGDRVRVLRFPHRNASATRGRGLAQAEGDWLAFLDADDWWREDKLERQLDFLARHPDVRFVSTDGDFRSADGVIRESWLSDYFHPVKELHGDLFPLLARRCFPLMSSCLLARDAYLAVGGMDPGLVYSHDYDLWLRVAARYPIALMAEPLVHYWFHPGSLSRRLEERHRDDLALMERIASGALRPDAAIRRLGEERAAALAYDIALLCVRDGRYGEARRLFARARRTGTLSRRALAAVSAWLPGPALAGVRRMRWLRGPVAATRARPARLEGPGAST